MRLLIVIFLLGHILGDYYFQSRQTAINKEKSIKKLLQHGAFYSIGLFISILPFWSIQLFIGAVVLAILHLSIDWIKSLVVSGPHKIVVEERERWLFLTDQAMHLISIVLVSVILFQNNYNAMPIPFLSEFSALAKFDTAVVLSWILAFLLIGKPTNITIKKIIAMHKPSVTEEEQTKTGGLIGILERIIMLMLLSVHQYSAIGLILTAKSIARYDKISSDKAFAEYFLLGTLLSIICVIMTYFLLIAK